MANGTNPVTGGPYDPGAAAESGKPKKPKQITAADWGSLTPAQQAAIAFGTQVAMEAAGVDAPYLCRGGACGQCETNVHKCDGTILHRDHWLSPEEQASNQKIMPCVSRFEGKTLVIDR